MKTGRIVLAISMTAPAICLIAGVVLLAYRPKRVTAPSEDGLLKPATASAEEQRGNRIAAERAQEARNVLRVKGRVIDGKTKRPLVARVECANVHTSTVPIDGSFAIDLDRVEAEFVVDVTAAGYQKASISAKDGLNSGDHDIGVVSLLRAGGTHFSVLDRDGHPAKGAWVLYRRQYKSLSDCQPPQQLCQVDVDGKGEAVVDVSGQVWALSEERTSASELIGIDAGVEDVQLTVRRPASSRLQLLDADSKAPIETERLVLRELNSSDSSPHIAVTTTSGYIDCALPCGTYSVESAYGDLDWAELPRSPFFPEADPSIAGKAFVTLGDAYDVVLLCRRRIVGVEICCLEQRSSSPIKNIEVWSILEGRRRGSTSLGPRIAGSQAKDGIFRVSQPALESLVAKGCIGIVVWAAGFTAQSLRLPHEGTSITPGVATRLQCELVRNRAIPRIRVVDSRGSVIGGQVSLAESVPSTEPFQGLSFPSHMEDLDSEGVCEVSRWCGGNVTVTSSNRFTPRQASIDGERLAGDGIVTISLDVGTPGSLVIRNVPPRFAGRLVLVGKGMEVVQGGARSESSIKFERVVPADYIVVPTEWLRMASFLVDVSQFTRVAPVDVATLDWDDTWIPMNEPLRGVVDTDGVQIHPLVVIPWYFGRSIPLADGSYEVFSVDADGSFEIPQRSLLPSQLVFGTRDELGHMIGLEMEDVHEPFVVKAGSIEVTVAGAASEDDVWVEWAPDRPSVPSVPLRYCASGKGKAIVGCAPIGTTRLTAGAGGRMSGKYGSASVDVRPGETTHVQIAIR